MTSASKDWPSSSNSETLPNRRQVAPLPGHPINRSNLGLSLAFSGQYDRAEQELQQALTLDTNNNTTRRLLEVVAADRRRRNRN